MTRRWVRSSNVSLVVLVMSVMVAIWVGARAISLEAVQEPAPPEDSLLHIANRTSGAKPESLEELRRLVHGSVVRNPFREDRSRPRVPYGTVGANQSVDTATPIDEFVAMPHLRLLGVASNGEGVGVAALELAGQGARVLRVGDEIAGYLLVSVGTDEARLRGRDSVLVLRVSSNDRF